MSVINTFIRLLLIEPTVQVVWYSFIFICRYSDFTVSVLPTDFLHDSKLPHDTKNTFMIHQSPNKIKHLYVKTTIAVFFPYDDHEHVSEGGSPHGRVLPEETLSGRASQA